MKEPLRIGIMAVGDRGWIGGVEYTKNIIFALNKYRDETGEVFDVSLIVNDGAEQDFIELMRPYVKNICKISDGYNQQNKIIKFIDKLNRKVLKKDYRFDRFLKEHFDFVFPYFTTNTNIFSGYSSWIEDFQHKYLPEFFTQEEIASRDSYQALIAREAPSVVLSSNTAGEDFNKFHPGFAHKRRILPFLTIPRTQWFEPDPRETQCKFHLPDRFFLVCNQFWQHKNHQIILEALEILWKKDIYPIVVCTGHIYDYRSPAYSDRMLQAIHIKGLTEQFQLLGLVEKIDQIQLARRSLAIIQPSLFEGWSSVVEDARCLGKPTILSDIAVHIEQNPPYSKFFDRHSPEALASVLAEAWESLHPGPDMGKEVIARDNNDLRRRFFVKQLLDIARCCAKS